MKVLIFTSAMLALAASDSCSDCTAVVSHIAGRLSTPESLAAQGEILVGELCPGAPDPEACVSGLPGLWNLSPLSSGLATGIPLLSGCALTSAQLQRTPP